MTGRLYVIGDPIGHSLSPVMHQAALDALRLDMTYAAIRVRPDELEAWVAARRHDGTVGWNVTVPHKEAMARLADELTPVAGRTGSVNTVTVEDGRLVGDSTDGAGFLRGLAAAGLDSGALRGARVVIAGAGGSARAVADALLAAGAGELLVVNRTMARAVDLASALSAAFPGAVVTAALPGDGAVRRALEGARLLVNTTTVGMAGGPDPRGLPLPLDGLGPDTVVYDLVYRPEVTPLLAEARRRGCLAVGGLPMLVQQGALALERWTGRPAPVDVMQAAVIRALAAP